MKKILFSLFSTSTIFATSQTTVPSTQLNEIPTFTYEEQSTPKGGFFYFRFSTAGSNFNNTKPIVHPGLGIGYRRLVGDGALDLSFNGLGHKEDRSQGYVWTAPRVSYVHYFSPSSNKSVYLGGGLGWGGIKNHALEQKFIGIIPTLLAGFEFFHNNNALGFTELSISQPALAVYTKGGLPGPSIELSLGAGF